MGPTSAMVVGLGSIGRRHLAVLRELGCRAIGVSRRPGVGDADSIADGLELARPDYVVIATATGDHRAGIEELAAAGYDGHVLIEKPIGDCAPEQLSGFVRVDVGYNLRFHPVITALRSRLAQSEVISVQARVGQHIADWRPGRHPATTASNQAGGGVLRDLSHELDLLEWLFGPSVAVTALGGHMAPLGLAVDDVWSVLGRYERAPLVGLELNYLDRPAHRFLHVTTTTGSLHADLIAATLTDAGDSSGGGPRRWSVGRNQTYSAMHRAALNGSGELCDPTQALRLMEIIASIETAASEGRWVGLPTTTRTEGNK